MKQWSYKVCIAALCCLGAAGCQSTPTVTPQRGMMKLSQDERVFVQQKIVAMDTFSGNKVYE